jgi:hypothetical protein
MSYVKHYAGWWDYLRDPYTPVVEKIVDTAEAAVTAATKIAVATAEKAAEVKEEIKKSATEEAGKQAGVGARETITSALLVGGALFALYLALRK